MSKRMLIDARHKEETRVTIVKGNRVEEFDYESATRRQLKGNIYLARVTRVEPSLQAAFVEYGGNRHGFLAFSEIHPDYYQIPAEDREAMIEDLSVEIREEMLAARKKRQAERSERRRTRTAAKERLKEQALEEDASASDVEDVFEGAAMVENVDPSAPSVDEEDQPVEMPELVGGDDSSSDALESDEDDEGEDEITLSEGAVRRRSLKELKRRYSIQEVIKKRQVILVQVVKEERGNKGAALTSYLSLAGRYCVLMPNATHSGGISRKISQSSDRKKLKSIIDSLAVPEDMGLIIRTAGIQRTKSEIKRDYEYLVRLWNDIRELTLRSVAPCLIYEEADLIKRTIRDMYSRDIDEVLVEGENGYRSAKDFMKLLMPSHAKKVQHYRDRIPLFHRYQVETALESMYQPVVQLRSGGYIVINPTEALISIDVNSGRSTREHNIEETAVKTNLEAAEEIARQLRLRDMAGLVVIDFIDMEERGNNRAVERRMKDVLKHDRARIQVGRISGFGLMELSRQRLRPNLLETSMVTCAQCEGTGIVRSVEFAALSALRQLEEEGIRARSTLIRLSANPDVCIYILNKKRDQLVELEGRYNMRIEVLARSDYSPSQLEMERIALSKADAEAVSEVISAGNMDEARPVAAEVPADDDDGDDGRKRRRRRRRRRDEHEDAGEAAARGDAGSEEAGTSQSADAAPGQEARAEHPEHDDEDEHPRPRRRRGRRGGRRRRKSAGEDVATGSETGQEADSGKESTASGASPAAAGEMAAGDDEAKADAKPRRRVRRRRKPESGAETDSAETVSDKVKASEPEAEAEAEAKPARKPRRRPARKKEEAAAEPAKPSSSTPAATEAAPVQAPRAEPDVKTEESTVTGPKRQGWWQRTFG